MVAQKITVSVPEQYAKWLDEHPLCSPSELLQQKIAELIQATDKTERENRELTEKVQMLSKFRQSLVDSIWSNLTEEQAKNILRGANVLS